MVFEGVGLGAARDGGCGGTICVLCGYDEIRLELAGDVGGVWGGLVGGKVDIRC